MVDRVTPFLTGMANKRSVNNDGIENPPCKKMSIFDLQ